MDNLEREVRTALEERLREVTASPTAPPDVLRRVRRRQAATALVASGLAVALAFGSFLGVRKWTEASRIPGDRPGPTVTETHGPITISYPGNWLLADIEGLSYRGDARLRETVRPVLRLTNYPSSPESGVCSRAVEDLPAEGVVLFVFRSRSPQGYPEWPVRLGEVGERSGFCGPGHYTRWHAGRGFFAAFAGFGAETSDADRQAVFRAFDSMQFWFLPAANELFDEKTGCEDSVRCLQEVATGPVTLVEEGGAGDRWRLFLYPVGPETCLTLLPGPYPMCTHSDLGPGGEALKGVQFSRGAGDDQEWFMFGLASKPVVRVEARLEGGRVVAGRIHDTGPDQARNLFVVHYPAIPGTVVALGARGNAVGSQPALPREGD